MTLSAVFPPMATPFHDDEVDEAANAVPAAAPAVEQIRAELALCRI